MSDAVADWTPQTDLGRTATTALVLGVLNVVCFGPLAGVPAVLLGLRAWSADRRAQVAVALGVVGTLGWTSVAATLAYPWLVHHGLI